MPDFEHVAPKIDAFAQETLFRRGAGVAGEEHAE